MSDGPPTGLQPQAAEHACHAQLLNHPAQCIARIFLHSRGSILSEIGLLGADKYLGDTQHDNHAKSKRHHGLNEAKTLLSISHGAATAVVIANDPRRTLPSSSLPPARPSDQLTLTVTFVPTTLMEPCPSGSV